VELPEEPKVRLVGDSVHVSPVAGDTAANRVTEPVNPFTGVTVIVAVPLDPATKATVVGLAVSVKSFTV
jgi:hypothetical protein